MGTPPGKLTKKYAISSSGEFYLKKTLGADFDLNTIWTQSIRKEAKMHDSQCYLISVPGFKTFRTMHKSQ